MSQHPFGWSYPPGCSGPPDDDEVPCEVCGNVPDECICPECPVCKTYGDPECYKHHGLVLTQEQIESKKVADEFFQKQNEMEIAADEAMDAQEDDGEMDRDRILAQQELSDFAQDDNPNDYTEWV